MSSAVSFSRIFLAASILALASGVSAEEAAAAPAITLHIGDPAPKMTVGKWIQGEPVGEYSRDKVYLVEFWATWCGPCKQNIPHLNELQKKLGEKGLVVIGQNCREPDQGKVEPFVKEQGDKMTYRVALDSENAMVKGWMDAAGRRGIPAAFLVDKSGKLAWCGHPAELSVKMIEQVLEGTFDVAAARAKADAAAEADVAFEKIRPVLVQALKEQKWAEADKLVDQWEAVGGEKRTPVVTRARIEVALGSKSPVAIDKVAEKLLGAPTFSPKLANETAMKIASADNIDGFNWATTEKLARRASEGSKGAERATALTALARVVFRSGRQEEAVKIQDEAIESAESDAVKRSLSRALDAYKAGKLPPAK